MKNFTALLFSLLIFIPLHAHDHCGCDYYLSAYGGGNFKPIVKEKSDGFKLRWHYQPGYFATTAFGCRLGSWRMEGELGYRQNRLKKLQMDEFVIHLHKVVTTWSGMGNVYYDFCLCPSFDVQGYVGLGLGYARAKDRSPQYQPENYLEVKRGFAWQVIAGVSYPVCNCLDVAVEYRYFTSNIDKEHNHDVGAGLRLWF